ncbi:MAG: hypothetical protein P8Z37_07225, partial [Acidobacteriota bacterium]
MLRQRLFPFSSKNKPPEPLPPAKDTVFSVDSRCADNPRKLTLEPTNQATETLIEAWRSGMTARGDAEIALRCGYHGIQVTSLDCCNRLQLEGIALYAVKRHGMYLRALETAPWNRINRKFSGIATVLVARLAQESIRNGFGGIIFAIPTGLTTEEFNRKLGFVYFRQYALKYSIAREAFPLGYEYSMVLDSSSARKLIAA